MQQADTLAYCLSSTATGFTASAWAKLNASNAREDLLELEVVLVGLRCSWSFFRDSEALDWSFEIAKLLIGLVG
jgi:hypothetical protein